MTLEFYGRPFRVKLKELRQFDCQIEKPQEVFHDFNPNLFIDRASDRAEMAEFIFSRQKNSKSSVSPRGNFFLGPSSHAVF